MKTPGAKKIGKGDSILSFEQSTVEVENDEDFIEDRIINRKELEDLGVLSFTFCVICQQVSTLSRKPVYCGSCESAVFCQACIKQWLKRSKDCPYCKQPST